ncbi:MAG: hypothetical protein CMO55_23145 [Verrucomicrobiales bacterium]|nr:hypothetical protein [Verrucomicrobiales bacterium]
MPIQQPENQSRKYEALFSDINEGRVKIPQFQRDFVWGKDRSAALIDSLIKGYPIGTFILWKTKERLRHMRDLGNVSLPEPPSGDSVSYVLDGQQRLTSLFAVRKGVILSRDGVEIDYRDIAINLDLDTEEEEQVVVTDIPADTDDTYISVHQLLTAELSDFVEQFPDYIKKIDYYRQRLTTYDFSTIVIDGYPIDVACDVFTRINTGGKPLTLFEIMVAKTYDHEKEFDLSREYDHLIQSPVEGQKDLTAAGYDTVPNVTVLQCTAAIILPGDIKRKEILKIEKADFIEAWSETKKGIFSAIDWLRSSMNVSVSMLLPYNTLLIPLTYFFVKNKHKPPTQKQDALLKQYFFWAALTNRYTSSVETKIGDDKKRIDQILEKEPPKYPKDELHIHADDLAWRRFSTGDAFCTAVLCLYAMQRPKSFQNNGELRLDNSWLQRSNSKNYHHFFPRAFLKKDEEYDWAADEINVVTNITLVDDYLNKRVISARPPSEYIADFEEGNDQLAKALESHLIADTATFGIDDDDYETFVEARAKLVAEHLNKLLTPGQ